MRAVRVCACLLAGIFILVSGTVGFPAGARPDAEDAARLTMREEDLVAELLDMNLDIMRLRQERDAQQETLTGIRQSIKTEEAGLARSETDLADARARLGAWLRCHYECGRWSYMEVLLGTHSFSDFFDRLEMLQILMRHEADLYNEVQRLNETIKARLAQLEMLQTDARREENRIRRQLTAIERTKAKRVAFLDEIRRQSGALADRITEIEQGWQASLKPLYNVLSRLNVLLVRELKPDRVSFEGTGIRLEVGAASVNKALQSVGGRPGDSLSVSLARNAITIRGRSTTDRSEFVLTGQLVPRAEGTAVYFRPRSLTVNGTGIEPDLLPALNRDGGLSFSLGQSYRFLSISQIRHTPDKVVVILRRA